MEGPQVSQTDVFLLSILKSMWGFPSISNLYHRRKCPKKKYEYLILKSTIYCCSQTVHSLPNDS